MLNTRQKCLLYVIKKVNACSKIRLDKMLFLIGKEPAMNEKFKFYNFIPYKFGPYSFEMFHDTEQLRKENLLVVEENSIRDSNPSDIKLDKNITNTLDYCIQELSALTEKEIVDFVYEKYPEYTIFSEIDKKMDYVRNRTGIFTIGYEGMSVDEFLMKLIDEKTHVLADVRANPYSQKWGFIGRTLGSFSEKLGIKYASIPSLGIPSEFRKNLKDPEDRTELFDHFRPILVGKRQELEALKLRSKTERIAMMCFEKDPLTCHRHILAQELERMGAEVTIG